jgi:hypothetical protein
MPVFSALVDVLFRFGFLIGSQQRKVIANWLGAEFVKSLAQHRRNIIGSWIIV